MDKRIARAPGRSALDEMEQIVHRFGTKRPLICLDYDGTLTPLAAHPDHAVLDETTRGLLSDLTKRFPVAVVSGRELRDLRDMVGIADLYYAGNHGLEIEGPVGSGLHLRVGNECAAAVEALDGSIRQSIGHVDGVMLEHKGLSLSLHFRHVAKKDVPGLRHIVVELVAAYPMMRLGAGKKVLEIRPDLDWHKGKAILHLFDHLSATGQAMLPLFIGDDVTDEDGFAAIDQCGITVRVGDGEHETVAHYRLDDSLGVSTFLRRLAERLP